MSSRRPARTYVGMAALASVLPLGAVGCSFAPPARSVDATSAVRPAAGTFGADQALWLTFETAADVASSAVRNHGIAPAQVEVVTVGDAPVRLVPGRAGGASLRLPELSTSERGPFQVLRVEATPGNDWLRPEDRDFEFGVDLMLDRRSDGTDVDNGNNVVQRGLYGEAAQYKLQVDKREPGCVVIGSDGTVEAKLDQQLHPGRWYRLRCERAGRTVSLQVTTWREDGGARSRRVTSRGSIGEVSPSFSTPLTVGGKLGADGEIPVSATDQLNGRVDNVVYRTR